VVVVVVVVVAGAAGVGAVVAGAQATAINTSGASLRTAQRVVGVCDLARLRRNVGGMTQSEAHPPASLEPTLLRVAAGARSIGVAWMVVLGAVVLERQFEWRVGVVLLVAIAWGSGSLLVYRRNPTAVIAVWAMAMDLAVSGAAIAVSNLGSDQNRIVGGYPLITVAIAAVRGRRAAWVAAGVLLAVVIASVSRNPDQNVIVENLSDIIFYAAGAFTFGWALEVLRDSDRERIGAQRALLETEGRHARAEERAEISRRLHDSVLQTLALIQRQAGNEPEVVRLARAQERELRGWLFAEPGEVGGRFAERLQSEAADVEARYRCVVDVVVVGDCDVTAKVESLLAAGREAMVNAAVHAPGERVSVYAECDEGRCRLFVRDRGPGFDLGTIPAGRAGVRDSIVGRLRAAGGSAELGNGPGTEWRLEVEP
jgi:signal transduction histidine kinase